MPDVDAPRLEASETDRPAVKRPRGFSAGFWILATLCAAAAAVAVFYAPDLKGMITLKPWNRTGAAQCVDAFAAAVRAGDRAGAETLAPGLECSDDLSKIKSPGKDPRQPLRDVEEQLPAGSASEGEFDYAYAYSELKLVVRAATGVSVRYTLVPGGRGAWTIRGFERVAQGPKSDAPR